jgi:CRISPR-associated endonuclease/helicase Cas3
MTFDEFFHIAEKADRFLFQREFAEAETPYGLVRIPTGLGKTAMAVLGWLWRRQFHGKDQVRKATPRRLVYCLPMRVLVEQTAEKVRGWIDNLKQCGVLKRDVPVHVLMGGEEEDDWDLHPEREAIIIGTQDMLLSRALNRGYAASRSRWPMPFGLLNNDCLWVFDEIQLMGPGLATTAQLEAFRHKLGAGDGNACQCVWMSATMQRDWLKTVDLKDTVDKLPALEFDEKDLSPAEYPKIKDRWEAKKPLFEAKARMGEAIALAEEIRDAHKRGTRTIVVVNTVRRARDLFDALSNVKVACDPPEIVLLHSRYRPEDRKAQVKRALDPPGPGGTIVVSTQVIEAGVDVSAMTLFTELAPWASLVQRFGRCNRRGEANDGARVFWVGLPEENKEQEEKSLPYDSKELKSAREQVQNLADVGLKSLPLVELPFAHSHVIRSKDMVDLFDTTPDLAGNDIDIDRFIRDVEETDVRVFWRGWNRPHKYERPSDAEPPPAREELCPARVDEFRDFTKKQGGNVWRWNFLDRKWEKADQGRIAPGQVYLVHVEAGGYSREGGWTGEANDRPTLEHVPKDGGTTDANEEDAFSRGVWETIAEHTDEVCKELDAILSDLRPDDADALRHAARWHDRGKAHEVFATALPGDRPEGAAQWAKAAGTWSKYNRRHFRHELGSALAVLDAAGARIPDGLRDLVAYLVAAHHGKVRLSIRSLPNENRPNPRQAQARDRRFARGVWDGDTLDETDLGGGRIAPAVALSLEPMELGLCQDPPFAGQPSWAERMIHLRDTLGPFRLAYLEAILRAADIRASRAAQQRAAAADKKEAEGA